MTGVLYAWVDDEGTYCLSRFTRDNPHFASKKFGSKEELEAEASKRGCEIRWQD